MSRLPPPRAHATGSSDRVIVANARGPRHWQQRIVGDPFAASSSSAAAAASSSAVAASSVPSSSMVMMDPRRSSSSGSGGGSGSAGSVAPLNSYGHSVTVSGHTSAALQSRQQQAAMSSREASASLLCALERFGPAPGAQAMLQWEREAALASLQSGLYVTWRSPGRAGAPNCASTDCTRVGPQSRCFCGHDYAQHGGPHNDGWKKNRMACDAATCACPNFSFMPRRPEECGEWWLVRRKEFDVRTYKAKCKCGHPHTDHDPKGSMHKCKVQPRTARCSLCSAASAEIREGDRQ